jgi:methylamine utilization protein MauE
MDPAIDLTVRAALALLLVVAALHKLRDPRRFAATLAEYRLLPGRLSGAASVLLVAAELATAAALGADRRLGLAAAAALLGLYAGAIAINLARGRRHIDCGCAGPAARRPISTWLVARNLALAGVALTALAPVAPRPLLWIDGVTVAAATVALAACWAATDRLLALAPGLARLREAT